MWCAAASTLVAKLGHRPLTSPLHHALFPSLLALVHSRLGRVPVLFYVVVAAAPRSFSQRSCPATDRRLLRGLRLRIRGLGHGLLLRHHLLGLQGLLQRLQQLLRNVRPSDQSAERGPVRGAVGPHCPPPDRWGLSFRSTAALHPIHVRTGPREQDRRHARRLDRRRLRRALRRRASLRGVQLPE